MNTQIAKRCIHQCDNLFWKKSLPQHIHCYLIEPCTDRFFTSYWQQYQGILEKHMLTGGNKLVNKIKFYFCSLILQKPSYWDSEIISTVYCNHCSYWRTFPVCIPMGNAVWKDYIVCFNITCICALTKREAYKKKPDLKYFFFHFENKMMAGNSLWIISSWVMKCDIHQYVK